MKPETMHEAICPKCGNTYTGRPALSRTDSTMSICPDCGTLEALESIGICEEEQQKILSIIHGSTQSE